ncbi:hypothetical protein MMC26_004039 [Xylographa opegraphella]|nr:hypothetical protein [Xylographa opegraphella]
MPPPIGSVSSSSTSNTAHSRAFPFGSASASPSDYSTSSFYQAFGSESSSQSTPSFAERARPTNARGGSGKEKDRSIATLHQPADYWIWSPEYQRYYHMELDPTTGDLNDALLAILGLQVEDRLTKD